MAADDVLLKIAGTTIVLSWDLETRKQVIYKRKAETAECDTSLITLLGVVIMYSSIETPVNVVATLAFIMYAKKLQMIFAFIKPARLAI